MLLRRSALALLPLLALLSTPARAGGTRTFEVEDYEAFDAGETEGAAIESTGKVTVGYRPQRVDISAATAFTCQGSAKEAWVGTADEAAVLRVAPKARTRAAKGKKGGGAGFEVEPVAKLDGVVVSALTELPDGTLAVATLPGGKIQRVDRKGRVSALAELKVDQIWALRVHEGRLLAATGPKGELWSMTVSGKDPKVVLDVDEKDLLSLEIVDGAILAGAAPRAKLYQVGDALEGTLIHEFDGDELRAIAVTPRGLLVAVNDFSDRKLTSLDALTKTLNRTSLVGQPPTGSIDLDQSPPSADATVYHVSLGAKRELARAMESPWVSWLDRDKQYFTDLLATEDGTVLVASSEGGKVYRLRGPRLAATVADLEERQATALCRVGAEGPIFATAGHGGAVYELEAAAAERAVYRTEVLDAAYPARYGSVVVRGRGDLRVRARGGPTDTPDDRWGAWRDVTLEEVPYGRRGELSGLPHRRHLQLEVTLGSRSAELRGLQVFYAPENLAPLVRTIDVDRPAFETDDDDEPTANVTIKWDVDARDEDDLVYDVRIRPEGGTDEQWVPLHRDEQVSKKELKLDLDTMPDGIYEVAVRASDEPSNGSAAALTDQLVSAPFVVDRQRPSLSEPRRQGNRITALVSDQGGYVHDVSFSIDGGPFRAASPADGVLDGPRETMVVELPASLKPGKHRVVLRARDSFGNIGTLAVFVDR